MLITFRFLLICFDIDIGWDRVLSSNSDDGVQYSNYVLLRAEISPEEYYPVPCTSAFLSTSKYQYLSSVRPSSSNGVKLCTCVLLFFFLALFHCAGPADVQGNKPMLLFLFGSAFAQVETTKF